LRYLLTDRKTNDAPGERRRPFKLFRRSSISAETSLNLQAGLAQSTTNVTVTLCCTPSAVAETGTEYVPAGVDVEPPPLPDPPEPPPDPPPDVGPELVQLVIPVTISIASQNTSKALRRRLHPSDKRASPQTSGAIGDSLRWSRMPAATIPVEICSVTFPVVPDPTVGLDGENAHVAFNGSVVQLSANVPCEPPSVVSTSV
jgi:hypothetical protein